MNKPKKTFGLTSFLTSKYRRKQNKNKETLMYRVKVNSQEIHKERLEFGKKSIHEKILPSITPTPIER